MADKPVLSTEFVQSLQSASIGQLNRSSAISLAIWGFINIGSWFLFGRGNVHIIAEASNPSTALYGVVYAGLLLGCFMLLLVLIGLFSRKGLGIFLDGVGMLTVGVWNIMNIFIVPGIIKPYGYEVTDGTAGANIWIMLGIAQVFWAFRAWKTYFSCREWPSGISSEEAKAVLTQSNLVLNWPEGRRDRVFKGTIHRKGVFGMGEKNVPLVGMIQEDIVYLISEDLRVIMCSKLPDFINHSELNASNLNLVYDFEGIYVKATLSPVSAVIYLEVTGQPMRPEIIAKIADAKQSPFVILTPYLSDPNPQVRYQAVKALGNSTESSVADLLMKVLQEDSGIPRSAVIEVYTQKDYNISPELLESLWMENDAAIIPALMAYVRKYPSKGYLPVIERYISSVNDPVLVRDLGKLAKACGKASR